MLNQHNVFVCVAAIGFPVVIIQHYKDVYGIR